MEARILLLMGRRVEALNQMARCRELARERNLPGIVRVVDRALALDPARLLERPGDAGRGAGGRPSERVWDRLGEAIRCAAAGEAGRMAALLADEEPELARPGHELGRVLSAIARAVLAEVRGDAGAARDELAAAAAHAAAAELDDDLVPALLGAVGSLRVVSAAGVRIARELPPPSSPDQIVLDSRTHGLAFGEQTVSLLKRPVLRRLLCCLARVNGAVVSKDDLARALWSRPHNPLSDDGPLKSNIANLRKLIEQAGMSVDFDEVGYRLVGVERLLFVEPVTWRVDPV
jgi:DNA-binding response OmpR family regulator